MMMSNGDDLDFSKILQDAEALSSEIEVSTDLPRVQRNLRQILETCQTLVNKNAKETHIGPNTEAKAAILLGGKGVDITKFSRKLEPIHQIISATQDAQQSEADLDTYLRQERANMICSIIDSTSASAMQLLRDKITRDLRTSWEREKEKIINSLGNMPGKNTSLDSELGLGDIRPSAYTRKMESISVLNKTELTFTHEVDLYVKALIHNSPKPNLLEKFDIVAQNTGDKNIIEMWSSINAMISSLAVNPTETVIERRSNPRTKKALITRARRFLESTYFSKIVNDVYRNLGKGRLGGTPAVIPIIKHYIGLKNISGVAGIELGPGDCGPVWAVIYLCLRTGKIEEAIKYLNDEVGNREFIPLLSEYMKQKEVTGAFGLTKDLESQVRLEYRRVLRSNSRDPYKKIVYCILGACDVATDHSEVASRLDDYLWLKLSQVRDEFGEGKIHNDYLAYSDFQDMILEKYGEVHFDAYKQPQTYFQALLLTGQFEAVIEFVSRIENLRCHGVHLAIVLHEMGLLAISEPKGQLLTRDKDDPPGIRRLNYCQLIVQWAKTFQGSNTKESLSYLYLLRNIKEHNGASLFSMCVSDLAIESRAFELLFGSMNPDGCKNPGILESMGISVPPIVDYCASQSEESGMLLDAAILYDLGGKTDSALAVLNRLIAKHANKKSENDSPRQQIQALSLSLAERYQQSPPNLTNKNNASTFYILVDLMTFFDEYHARRTENALAIIERMRILPMYKEDVDRCISNYHSYSDEIRSNIPELILTTLECLLVKYKKIKSDKKSVGQNPSNAEVISSIKNKAKTLVTYCGLVPYFITSEVYSKVMQIEVQIN